MCPASSVLQRSRWPEAHRIPPGYAIRIVIIKSPPYSRMRRCMIISGADRISRRGRQSSRNLHKNKKLRITKYIISHNNLNCRTTISSGS